MMPVAEENEAVLVHIFNHLLASLDVLANYAVNIAYPHKVRCRYLSSGNFQRDILLSVSARGEPIP